MRIDTCLLCDAATVREGLLNILGGGITHAVRQEYPAPLGMSLAMRIMVHSTEITGPHRIEVMLNDEDGQRVTNFHVDVGVPDETEIPPGLEPEIMFAWDFPGRPMLPHPGKYSFEVLIDRTHHLSVPFSAALPPDGGDQQ
jgi:hypothetical protein